MERFEHPCHTLLPRYDDIQHQRMQDKRLDLIAVLVLVNQEFSKLDRREPAVAEDPFERRADAYDLARRSTLSLIAVLQRRYLERRAEYFDGRLQLSRKIEWFGARRDFIECLQLLKRNVGTPNQFLGAALNVVAEYTLGTEQR